jgi:hypothetical protein
MVRPSRALVIMSAIVLCAACGSSTPSAPTTHTPVAAVPTPEPTAAPTPAATPAPTPETTPAEHLTETIDLTKFSNPTKVDNPWFPLVPGTRMTWEGSATVDGERLKRKVVFTVTDLTKVISGVRTVVGYDLDYTDDQMEEAEIALWAQDDDGYVWHFGQYPEVYEDGKIAETPAWLHGFEDALAGISMKPEPQPFAPSYSQGWGPAVGWNDRAKVFETGSKTCVPVACYDGVLVIDEFSRDEPDAHQLKYYARDIGNVRVGWAGALEEEREVLVLTRFEHLDPAALAEIRSTVLAQDARGYQNSPNVYGKTAHAEAPAA